MTWLKQGNIRGPQGPPGPPGPAGPPGAAGEGYLTEIRALLTTVIPAGWLLLNGQVIANGDTLYPELWAVLPPSMKSGTNIVLPDARDHVLQGATAATGVGVLTGSNARPIPLGALPAHTHTIAHVHSVPAHTHTMAHTHTIAHTHSIAHDHPALNTAAGGAHTHTTAALPVAQFGTSTLGLVAGGTGRPLNTHGFLIDTSATHTHQVDIPSFAGNSGASSAASSGGSSAASTGASAAMNTGGAVSDTSGSTGAGGALDVQQASLRVNWIMRAAFV